MAKSEQPLAFEELAHAVLAEVTGGNSPNTWAQSYRSLSRIPAIFSDPHSQLGRAPMWEPNYYVESLRGKPPVRSSE